MIEQVVQQSGGGLKSSLSKNFSNVGSANQLVLPAVCLPVVHHPHHSFQYIRLSLCILHRRHDYCHIQYKQRFGYEYHNSVLNSYRMMRNQWEGPSLSLSWNIPLPPCLSCCQSRSQDNLTYYSWDSLLDNQTWSCYRSSTTRQIMQTSQIRFTMVNSLVLWFGTCCIDPFLSFMPLWPYLVLNKVQSRPHN